jgi:uncharacterized protein (DUF427 family)
VAICVQRKSDGSVLVRAENPEQVIRLEGNYYFHPDVVDTSIIEITDRTYHCHYKGVCNWIDLATDKGFVTDIAWIYPETKQDYEYIRGWYGFYADHRYYETRECD